jgi:two-component system nitrogen regulation response regulator GlnG
MPTLLVIDDEPSVQYAFRRVFGDERVTVLEARTAAEGRARAAADRPDVIVLDIQLPDGSGLDLFRELHEADPKRPVIFITAHGTTETAIEAMKGGAFDYLVKPLDLDRLSALLGRAFDAARLMQTPTVLPQDPGEDRIVGHSLVMQEMCKAVGRIAPQAVSVLILGESGTGKELVARALYQHSRRADRPFLAINCASLPETLLESELFGHEKGAFTGADRKRIGKFEQADEGTLFLDEIGDMPLPMQAKMLRVLQDQRFERLGGNETVQTRVRLLAATNQDLAKLVEEGRFRKDLYYRLNAVTIRVPPLRDRPGDVAELAHYFLFNFDAQMGLDLRGFDPAALALLEQYPWPGNVRELRNAIQWAMLNASGHLILSEFLPDSVRQARPAESAAAPATNDLERLIDRLLERSETEVYARVMEVVERTLFNRVLRHTHGHQAQASDILGINRTTLRHKLRALGLGVDKMVTEGGEDG